MHWFYKLILFDSFCIKFFSAGIDLKWSIMSRLSQQYYFRDLHTSVNFNIGNVLTGGIDKLGILKFPIILKTKFVSKSKIVFTIRKR